MNPAQSPDQPPINQAIPPVTNRLGSFLQKHLISTIVFSTCLNLGLTGASTWSVWNTSQQLEATVAKQDKQQDLSSKLAYWDEVLTMSALMYTSTGQVKWEHRYTKSLPAFDKVWSEFVKEIPPTPKIDAANTVLLGTEVEVFKLAKQGKLKDAAALLSSSKYQEQKKIYAAEVATMVAKIRTAAESEVIANRQSLSDAFLLEIISLGLLVGTGSLVVMTVRRYILDREQSQQSLQIFQKIGRASCRERVLMPV